MQVIKQKNEQNEEQPCRDSDELRIRTFGFKSELFPCQYSFGHFLCSSVPYLFNKDINTRLILLLACMPFEGFCSRNYFFWYIKTLSKMEACVLLKTQAELKERITIRAHVYHGRGKNCCSVSVVWSCTIYSE